MTFRKKIDKILDIKKISLNKLCEDSGLRSTLSKAYNDNEPHGREMGYRKTQEFLEKMNINPEWWDTEKGEVFNKKGTSMPKPSDAGNELDRLKREVERLTKDLEREMKLNESNEKVIALLESKLAGGKQKT